MTPELKMILQNMQADIREIKEENREEFQEVRKELKDLHGFKWKVAGMATATTTIIGLILKVMFH